MLFFTQGGFGGGHGNFDGLIVILGLPSIYLVQMVFLPEWVLYFDLLLTYFANDDEYSVGVDRLPRC